MFSAIINRVEKSSLRTIDPDLFYQNIEVISFDLKPFLRDGLLLIEKDFRKSIEDHNWNHESKSLFLKYSSLSIK